MKKMVLDPPMPWGEDDQDGFKKLRGTCLIVSIILGMTMYGSGFHPRPYYYLIGDNRSLLDLSNSTIVFEGILGLLFIIPAIAITRTGFYRQTEEQSLATKRNQQFYYLLIAFILIIATGIVYGIFSSRMGSFLIFGQLMVVLGCIVMPAAIIRTSVPVWSYTLKIILNVKAYLGNWFHDNIPAIYIFSCFPQRSPQIQPII